MKGTHPPALPKRVARSILKDHQYLGLSHLYQRCRVSLDWRHRVSVSRVRAFQNTHRGERCFILGNGPSLRDTDLSYLEREFSFGLNRIYLLFDELGFATTYYVSVNKLVVEQCAEEIVQRVPCPKFISYRARDLIEFTPGLVFLHPRPGPRFYTDITQGVWEGATVTYVAMQIAFYLGFEKVVLVGVDHSFETKGPPHKTVVSQGDDPNHFDPEYFGKGFRWQLPDLETSELAYRLAKYQFERVGRQIVDATIGGQLEVFPKADYYTLFREGKNALSNPS